MRAPEHAETDAAKPVDNQVFFIRFAQRVHAPADHAFGGRPALRSRRAAAAVGQGRHVDHAHRRVRRIPGEGSLDLGAPGAAACARRGRRCRRCAPSSSACASTCSCAACGATRCAPRCATCASACARSCRSAQAGFGQVRHQAGCRRHRRHRIPGAVLGAAARRHASAGGDVRRHHPAARIRGLRRPRAAGDRRRADARLSKVSRARPSPVARAGRSRGAGGGIRGRARRGDAPSGTRRWAT